MLSWVILKLASPDRSRSLFSLSSTLSDRFEDLTETITNLENMVQDKSLGEYQSLVQTARPRWESGPSQDVGGHGLEISEP